MTSEFNPIRKMKVVCICEKTGNGVSVDVDGKLNMQQEALAMAMVADCETERGGCPENCQIRSLLEREG